MGKMEKKICKNYFGKILEGPISENAKNQNFQKSQNLENDSNISFKIL